MKSRSSDYVLLDHTADLGITVRGRTIQDLFENAAQAMMEILLKVRRAGGAVTSRTLEIAGPDFPDLLVRFLGELLYLFEGEKEVVLSARVTAISPERLEVSLKSVPFDPEAHTVLRELKAVTYHQADVQQKADGWEATIVFDL